MGRARKANGERVFCSRKISADGVIAQNDLSVGQVQRDDKAVWCRIRDGKLKRQLSCRDVFKFQIELFRQPLALGVGCDVRRLQLYYSAPLAGWQTVVGVVNNEAAGERGDHEDGKQEGYF